MRQVFIAAAALLALSQAASASANLDCSAKDKNAELVMEAITSRDGKYLDNLRGELQLASGEKIELDKKNVTSFKFGSVIAISFGAITPKGRITVGIYARSKQSDDIDYEGTYVVTVGKIKKGGKIKCSAG